MDTQMAKKNKMTINNKVYYGEYSLDYWIKLILKKDIVLPDYQRYFVWEEDQIATLVTTLKRGFFIPPIIIGACTVDGEEKNIIIDGQQRLTSVLLSYFKVYPKPDSFKEDNVDLADASLPKRWTFREITENFTSVEETKTLLSKDVRYKKLDIELSTEELKHTYIGFSYIVPEIPDNKDSQAQQNYFSTIFRSINQQGTVLKDIESRKALYFLNADMVKWFDPELTMSVGKTKKKIPFDYIKYISILTEYYKRHVIDNDRSVSLEDCIPSGDSKTIEKYYEKYIYTFTGVDFEGKVDAQKQFGNLTDIYTDSKFQLYIQRVQKYIEELKFCDANLTTVIALDVYFYGLLYYVLFKKRELNLSKKDSLINSLARESKTFANQPEHVKSQKSKTYWRERIEKSINIYMHYLKK